MLISNDGKAKLTVFMLLSKEITKRTEEIMDCTFQTGEGKFNFRVGAFIRDGDRILMAKNPNEKREFWYSVGGRVHFGETAQEAVLRELKEETGLTCEVEKLCAVHENFFTDDDGVPFHECSLFFLVKLTDDLRAIKSGSFTDKGPAGEFLEWIDLNHAAGKTLYPDFFTTTDFCTERGVIHFVTKDDVTVRG